MLLFPSRNLPLIVCVFFSTTLAIAQSSLDASVSDYVKSEMNRQHIPGLALLVSKGGKIVRAEGFGIANVELQVPVKPETIFQSGSVGKQFTAAAIMMLVDDGKLGLEDSLLKYFPEGPASWKNVTVRIVKPYRGIRRLS
jgi:CubicO group peptidase (beta-lactamase class C family)